MVVYTLPHPAIVQAIKRSFSFRAGEDFVGVVLLLLLVVVLVVGGGGVGVPGVDMGCVSDVLLTFGPPRFAPEPAAAVPAVEVPLISEVAEECDAIVPRVALEFVVPPATPVVLRPDADDEVNADVEDNELAPLKPFATLVPLLAAAAADVEVDKAEVDGAGAAMTTPPLGGAGIVTLPAVDFLGLFVDDPGVDLERRAVAGAIGAGLPIGDGAAEPLVPLV
jgi:hypothetical protein